MHWKCHFLTMKGFAAFAHKKLAHEYIRMAVFVTIRDMNKILYSARFIINSLVMIKKHLESLPTPQTTHLSCRRTVCQLPYGTRTETSSWKTSRCFSRWGTAPARSCWRWCLPERPPAVSPAHASSGQRQSGGSPVFWGWDVRGGKWHKIDLSGAVQSCVVIRRPKARTLESGSIRIVVRLRGSYSTVWGMAEL